MHFNHTKQTRELIETMDRTHEYIKSKVHRVSNAQFEALKAVMVDDVMRKQIVDEIPMKGYVIKKVCG